MISSSVTLAFFPALIRRWNSDGREEAIEYLNQVLNTYIAFLLPATVGLCIIGNHLYGTFIDVAYSDGVFVIIWSSVGFFFWGMNNILYKMWQLQEKTTMILKLMFISLIVNVILNCICLPLFGYKAAAVTTFVSYMLIFVLAVVLICRQFKIEFYFGSILKTFVASTIMGVFLNEIDYLLDSLPSLMLGIFAAVCVFVAVMALLGETGQWKTTIYKCMKR